LPAAADPAEPAGTGRDRVLDCPTPAPAGTGLTSSSASAAHGLPVPQHPPVLAPGSPGAQRAGSTATEPTPSNLPTG
jgi:hypothetical protein